MDFKMQLETLSSSAQQTLINIVQNGEGFRPNVYNDKTGLPWVFPVGSGNPTWLYGINLREAGDKNIGYLLTTYRLCQTETELMQNLPWFAALPSQAKMALMDMAYNLGVPVLMGFDDFLKLLQAGNYAGAAADLASTHWYIQVGTRAKLDQQLIASCA